MPWECWLNVACSIARDDSLLTPFSPLSPSSKGSLSYGFWEKQVLGAQQGQTHPEYEAEQFRRAFRMSKPACSILLRYLSKTQSCAVPFLLQRDWLFFWTGQGLDPPIRPLHAHTMLVKLQFAIFMKLFSFWGAAERRGLPVGGRPLVFLLKVLLL